MLATASHLKLSPEDYLQGEQQATVRSEYIAGEVYAMAGASDGHVTIAGNLFALLKTYLRGSGCKPYVSDMKLRVGEDTAYFYPDVFVSCDAADQKRNYFKQAPLLIIEVLSTSTEAYDRGGKFALYRKIESLHEYVLIDPRTYRIDLFRRNEYDRWELFSLAESDALVEFNSLELSVPMLAIYEDVDFELA